MLPPIDTSLIPANVRNAGPQAVKLYGVALQFEGLLTSQITQQMFDATQSTDDGSDGGPYQSMLPGALSDSITGAGGLGLADQLYRSFGGTYAAAPPSDGGAQQEGDA
ncbi:MAG TPA: rod-binding protein [Gaiellales bacterium]|jgi:Rod binding domain-containing protein|nr:rod-binding protein [Gaiellales bacterium]